MYLSNSTLRSFSTNQRKAYEKLLHKQGDDWYVREGDATTGTMVVQEMRQRGFGWCKGHNEWHEIDLATWHYRVPQYAGCPTPILSPTDLQQHLTGPQGPPREAWDGLGEQGDGAGEGEGTEGEGLDEGLEQRFDDYFEADGEEDPGGEQRKAKAKKEAQQDGTLPKDMKQKGKDEQLEKDVTKQCPVMHGKFKCTLKADHDGDHIGHWSDGKVAKRWKGDQDKLEPDSQKRCGHRIGVYYCTKTKGHTGDHVAHSKSTGWEITREKQTQMAKKWKLRMFNRCPDCRMESLVASYKPAPEPKIEEQIIYTEDPCGCKALKEIGF